MKERRCQSFFSSKITLKLLLHEKTEAYNHNDKTDCTNSIRGDNIVFPQVVHDILSQLQSLTFYNTYKF